MNTYADNVLTWYACAGALILIACAFMTFAVAYYAMNVLRDARLGRAFREHKGSRESAWKAISAQRAVENEKADVLMRRGFRALTDTELDELLNPRVRPFIRPDEFRVVERGKPVHFDDDRSA